MADTKTVNANNCDGGVCTTDNNNGTNANQGGGTISTIPVFRPVGIDVIYFTRPDCPNCVAVEPWIKLLENSMPRSVKYSKINSTTGEGQQKVNALGIKGVPAIAIGINGQVKEIYLGPLQIEAIIKSSNIFQIIGDPENLGLDPASQINIFQSFIPMAVLAGIAYLAFKK